MKCKDGQELRIGDLVRLGDDPDGVVVVCIDNDQYAPGYPKADWEYLAVGAMINFPKYGLIHYEETDFDLQLIARSS